MVEQNRPLPLDLCFEELLKEARRIPIYTGDNDQYALTPWLEEANLVLALAQPGDQRTYLFRLIIHKLQGAARAAIQKIIEPTWESVKTQLISTFGVSESYSSLVNQVFRLKKLGSLKGIRRKGYKKRVIWSNLDIDALLKIWPEYRAALLNTRRTTPIYIQMARRLAEHGSRITPLEIKIKCHNLHQRYRKEKEQMEESGTPSEWEHYTEVDRVFQIDKNDPIPLGILEECYDETNSTVEDIDIKPDASSLSEASMNRTTMQASPHPVTLNNPNVYLARGKISLNSTHESDPLEPPMLPKSISASREAPEVSTSSIRVRSFARKRKYKDEILSILKRSNELAEKELQVNVNAEETNRRSRHRKIEYKADILNALQKSNQIAERELDNNVRMQGALLKAMEDSNKQLEAISERILATQESIFSLVKNRLA